MKSHQLPWSSVVATIVRNPLVPFADILLCLAPLAAPGQSVTFADAQSTLQANDMERPAGVAVDSAGDVFISDSWTNRVVELPWTGTGFGRQTTLPFTGLPTDSFFLVSLPGVAVDSGGDVFVTDGYNASVLGLPWTGSNYGAQVTLPLSDTYFYGLAVDGSKNLFFNGNNNVFEFPWTGTGYGAQVPLTNFSGYIALDSNADLFITDKDGIVELPKAETGFGPPQTVITTKHAGPLALDGSGNVFVASTASGFSMLEYPWTGTSYGPRITLPTDGLSGAQGLAVDGSGNLFITETFNTRVTELQTRSVNFESANVCASGERTPAPCSITLPLYFTVNVGGTLGTPQVLTDGAAGLDFTLAGGSTCTGDLSAGSACVVNVTFTPTALGARNGSVEITDGSGNVLATTALYGTGVPPGTLTPPVAQVSAIRGVIYFDSVAVGSSETGSMQIYNAGTGPFGGTLTFVPSIDARSFKIVGNSCVGGVRSATYCWLQIQFSPVSAAPHHDTLTLQTNGASNVTIGLDGAGIAP